MKIKLEDYIKKLENENKKDKIDKNLPEEILHVIEFLQHERFVHLIVTFFAGISTILFLISFLVLENIFLFLLFLVTFCLFVPYIFHYYYLENGTQKLYDLYLDISRKEKHASK